MDANETAAMTEASGLGAEAASPSRTAAEARKQTDLQKSAEELAERLRKVTLEAPLRSLLGAFLLGVWFARRF
ncbi:hypothetical protein ABIF64_000117 [Bradyrhizobium japonicum]|jgi:hypothetical protein|uniref:DUF3618 domain-containing protein n=1 Tax=Bradyrhizobium japonicum TaxID=375 RepID=A0ABV2RL93_BRAJP|nr:hypothetical protein [Bradyrhizobium japonicum]MCP1794001.1 hypothetical protein [Bradyrhizobium japonicum]MCP1806434.1 hypothetical protein [Bradyrhizobium japonicum]MCP1815362.1 hypothetical protein [Bradyrhizobium japonicum]MCP1873121.1 hypothetical protein [Bradyrhizobium japonicum]